MANTRKEIGPVMKVFARQKGCEILEGKLMPGHVHMLIAIPPKYSVSSVIGYYSNQGSLRQSFLREGQSPALCGIRWSVPRDTLNYSVSARLPLDISRG